MFIIEVIEVMTPLVLNTMAKTLEAPKQILNRAIGVPRLQSSGGCRQIYTGSRVASGLGRVSLLDLLLKYVKTPFIKYTLYYLFLQ